MSSPNSPLLSQRRPRQYEDQYGNIVTEEPGKPQDESAPLQNRIHSLSGFGSLPPEEHQRMQNRSQNAVIDAAPYFPNVPAMGIAGGLGFMNDRPPIEDSKGANTGQALAGRIAEAGLRKAGPLGPLVKYGVGAGADVAGGIAGAAVDRQTGGAEQTMFQKVLSAITGGASQLLPGMKGVEEPPPWYSNSDRPFAESLPGYLGRATEKGGGFRVAMLRGDDQVMGDTARAAEKRFDELGIGALPQSNVEATIQQASERLRVPIQGVERGALERLNKAATGGQSVQEMFQTMFGYGKEGYDPTKVANTVHLLQKTVDPEVFEPLMRTWFLREIVYGAFTPKNIGPHSGQYKGLTKFIDVAETGPKGRIAEEVTGTVGNTRTRVPTKLEKGKNEFDLNADEFLANLEAFGEKNIDLVMPKGTYKTMREIGDLMRLLDPRQSKTPQEQIASLLGSSLKYNANRALFFGLQGDPGTGGFSAVQTFVRGTSVVAGAVGLDALVMKAVKNPQAFHNLVVAVSTNNRAAAQASARAVMATDDRTMPPPRQEITRPMPVPNQSLR